MILSSLQYHGILDYAITPPTVLYWKFLEFTSENQIMYITVYM